MSIQKIEISSRTIVFTVFFLIFLKVIWIVRELVFAFFLAFIFMSALKPTVNILERRGIPRTVGSGFVFFLTIVVIILIGAYIFPPVILESITFIKNLPLLLSSSLPILSPYIQPDAIFQFLPDIAGNFFRVAAGLFSNLLFVLSVLFFTLYFLIEEKFMNHFLNRFLDEKDATRIVDVIYKAEIRMGSWLRGQLVLMIIIGIMTFIGLMLLGVPYAVPLAVIAGLFEFVPIMGPVISLVPALLVALSVSPLLGLLVIIMYVIIRQLENNLIVPVVMKQVVGLHPIVTLGAIIVGGKLGGTLGVIISVPMALFIETILMDIVKFKKSG